MAKLKPGAGPQNFWQEFEALMAAEEAANTRMRVRNCGGDALWAGTTYYLQTATMRRDKEGYAGPGYDLAEEPVWGETRWVRSSGALRSEPRDELTADIAAAEAWLRSYVPFRPGPPLERAPSEIVTDPAAICTVELQESFIKRMRDARQGEDSSWNPTVWQLRHLDDFDHKVHHELRTRLGWLDRHQARLVHMAVVGHFLWILRRTSGEGFAIPVLDAGYLPGADRRAGVQRIQRLHAPAGSPLATLPRGYRPGLAVIDFTGDLPALEVAMAATDEAEHIILGTTIRRVGEDQVLTEFPWGGNARFFTWLEQLYRHARPLTPCPELAAEPVLVLALPTAEADALRRSDPVSNWWSALNSTTRRKEQDFGRSLAPPHVDERTWIIYDFQRKFRFFQPEPAYGDERYEWHRVFRAAGEAALTARLAGRPDGLSEAVLRAIALGLQPIIWRGRFPGGACVVADDGRLLPAACRLEAAEDRRLRRKAVWRKPLVLPVPSVPLAPSTDWNGLVAAKDPGKALAAWLAGWAVTPRCKQVLAAICSRVRKLAVVKKRLEAECVDRWEKPVVLRLAAPWTKEVPRVPPSAARVLLRHNGVSLVDGDREQEFFRGWTSRGFPCDWMAWWTADRYDADEPFPKPPLAPLATENLWVFHPWHERADGELDLHCISHDFGHLGKPLAFGADGALLRLLSIHLVPDGKDGDDLDPR